MACSNEGDWANAASTKTAAAEKIKNMFAVVLIIATW
jgi:hypothetical protein